MSDRPQSLMSMDQRRSLPATSINQIVYSWPGVGKTPFWGTGGETLLLMDSDHGLESAIASNSKADVVDVTDHDQLNEVYLFCRHSNDAKKYRWVVWDSLTLFMDRSLIDDVAQEAAAANPKESKDVVSQRSYLVQQNRIGTKVRDFCALPMNFGVSCHVWAIEVPGGENEGELMYAPMIEGGKGKFCTKIMGYFNVISYLGVKRDGITRRLITGGSDKYIVRDRFNALRTGGKPFIDKPTVTKIEQLVKEKLISGQNRNQGEPRGRRSRRVVR